MNRPVFIQSNNKEILWQLIVVPIQDAETAIDVHIRMSHAGFGGTMCNNNLVYNRIRSRYLKRKLCMAFVIDVDRATRSDVAFSTMRCRDLIIYDPRFPAVPQNSVFIIGQVNKTFLTIKE